jgi:alpha-tubulin suppressor-like RCC1 family protein
MLEDTHVAKVSCADKHTLILDVNGKLWYFGAK